MNAKKIMGAVLVALLAAALFVGAGAAAITADVDGKTVFVNQKVSKDNYSGNWVGPAAPEAVADGSAYVYFKEAGVYTAKVDDKTVTITVKAPELTINGVVGNKYTFIPGNFYLGGEQGTIYVVNPSGLNYTLYYTTPATTEVKTETNATQQITVANDAVLGEYTLQAEFNASNFVVGTTPEQLITAPVTFSVVKAETAVTISAAETTVLKSESIKLTITGQPGVAYNVTYENANAFIVSEQIGFTFKNISGDNANAANQKNGIQFNMPAGGKATFTLKANATTKSSEKIIVKAVAVPNAKQASIVINFEKGTISAQAEKATYFVGDEIKITGTSTAGNIAYIAINGNNFENATFKYGNMPTLNGNDFEFTFDTGDIVDGKKLLDVGTYTLSIGNGNGVNATVPLTLKQPFINIISAPEVVVQGEEDVKIIINAEAAPMIGYYIFGNNFYYYNEESTHVTEDDGDVIKNQFEITLDDLISSMAAGQYFIVFQHPMNNEVLDVYGNKSVNNWTIVVPTGQNINVDKRQTANAAQALCDALEAQGIDDMYVKATFFVSDKDNSFSISEIPATVAQGETITISGVDTVNKGKPVVVEMLSSAFTAIPKEDENAAAFIVVTTTIADDGTWEVTLDTSALAVDEYNVAVKIAGEIEKTAKVNVVEADEPVNPEQPEEPEQPEQPEEPVAPATPGFGALAALAGLGAVAVLLLRRE